MITKLEKILQEIYESDITIVEETIAPLDLIAVSMRHSDKKFIFIDKAKCRNSNELRVILTHEYFHFKFNTMYNLNVPFNKRYKLETKTDKKATKSLVPLSKLIELTKQGFTNKWEIAEELGVTEEVIESAYNLYKDEGLITFSEKDDRFNY